MSSIPLGPLVIPVALLPWIGAFLGAWLVALVRARGSRRSSVEPLVWWVALGALLAARAGFVIRYHESFSGQWWSMLDLRDGGLWWPGALLGALAVLVLAPGFRRVEQRRERMVVGGAGALAALPLIMIAVALSPRGFPAPSETLQTLAGEPVAFDEYTGGQLSLVNIWASWCPHCHRSMPVLERGQHEYERVRFVVVNQGEAGTTVGRYLHREGLAFEHVLLDPHARIAAAVGSRGVPTTLVIDAEGNVVDLHTGRLSPARLEDLLRPHL